MPRLVVISSLLLLVGCMCRERSGSTVDGVGCVAPGASSVLLPARDASDYAATQVVDAITGRPIEGATLRYYVSSKLQFEYARPAGCALSDRDGFVWLALLQGEPPVHWVITAPGYAPNHATFELPPLIRLSAGQSVSGRLLDWRGNPAPGVQIEYYLGGPRGPTVMTTRSLGDGAFCFTDVNPEIGGLWVHAPLGNCPTLSHNLRSLLRFGSRTADLVMEPGVSVRGTVVDLDGHPVPGIVILAEGRARGPVTRTDSLGQFMIPGIPAGSDLQVIDPRRQSAPSGTVRAPSERVSVRIRLGPDGVVWEEHRLKTAELITRDERSDTVASVGLALTRLADGRSWFVRTGDSGRATLDVPAGDYRVAAATPFEPLQIQVARVSVTSGMDQPHVVVGQRAAPVKVPSGVWQLVADGYSLSLGDDPSTPYLPVQSYAVARSDFGDIAVPAVEGGGRRVIVSRPQGHRISVAGASMRRALIHPARWYDITCECLLDDEAQPTVWTRACGPLLLSDVVVGDQVRSFLVDLPCDRWVDVRLAPTDAITPPAFHVAKVRIEGAAGIDLNQAVLRVSPLWGMEALRRNVFAREWPDSQAQGVRPEFEIDLPCHLELSAPGWVTIDRTLASPGTHKILWGPSSIRLSVLGPDARPVDATALLDGRLYGVDGGALVLHGISPGFRRLVVSPRTARFSSAECAVSVPPSGTLVVNVALSRR